MTDEIRIYHVDDPNDDPYRRLCAFPTLNTFIPTSLPNYVIPPVANSLYSAMHYYWYSAYQQGIAAQKQQQQQQQHQHHQQQQRLQQQQQTTTITTSPAAASPDSQQQQLEQQHQHQHQQHQQQQRLQQQQLSTNTSTSTSTSSAAASPDSQLEQQQQQQNNNHRHQHIKKPLNPFMIYMQKMRPEIVRQGQIKESAAINRLLGQQWRTLSKEDQEPYYKLAEQEKILHAQKYPGWSARDNYANQKKKKKLKLRSISLNGQDQLDRKCRARFGLGNMNSWCKPCRRKKKCIYSVSKNCLPILSGSNSAMRVRTDGFCHNSSSRGWLVDQ